MRAVIVQARLGSTRLPGKIMMDLGGHTVLWHVLQRCLLIDADVVVCAIPDTQEDHALIAEIKSYKLDVRIVRGPHHDLLLRYWMAATAVKADEIIRVTSDCPLIDPKLCDQTALLLKQVSYACNNDPRTWPHGLDCEAFTMEALEDANIQAKSDYDREHVGPWMKNHLRWLSITGPVSTGRWVLDYVEDYYFLRALFGHLPSHFASWEEVQEVLDDHPEISSLNALRSRYESRTA